MKMRVIRVVEYFGGEEAVEEHLGPSKGRFPKEFLPDGEWQTPTGKLSMWIRGETREGPRERDGCYNPAPCGRHDQFEPPKEGCPACGCRRAAPRPELPQLKALFLGAGDREHLSAIAEIAGVDPAAKHISGHRTRGQQKCKRAAFAALVASRL